MDEELSLEGPVLRINGELMLLIPLEAGGAELMECSRGISEVQGEFLKIVIPEWLAGVLRIEEEIWCAFSSQTGHSTFSHARRGL
jgi:hypothetical protein